MNIQIGANGNIWFCSEKVIGCDVIPIEFFWISFGLVCIGFWIGFFIGKRYFKNKEEVSK